MPKARTYLLGHANSIARVGECGCRSHGCRPELPLQFLRSFEAATGKHHRALRHENGVAADDAPDFIVLAPQPMHRRANADFDAAPEHVLVHEPKHIASVDHALRPRVWIRDGWIKSWNVIDLDVTPCFVARQRIISRCWIDLYLGAERVREFTDVFRKFDRAARECGQDRLRSSLCARGLQIGERLFGTVRSPQAAAGANRNSARNGLFFEEKNLGAGIVSLDGRNCSREAKTDDDNIKRLPHQDLASAKHA